MERNERLLRGFGFHRIKCAHETAPGAAPGPGRLPGKPVPLYAVQMHAAPRSAVSQAGPALECHGAPTYLRYPRCFCTFVPGVSRTLDFFLRRPPQLKSA